MRLFAAVLLVWTAAHLFDHCLCAHDHERLGRFEQAAFRSASTDASSYHDGFDDSFCCSHVVDVRSPFQFSPHYDVSWTLPQDIVGHPALPAAPLYHPPLAQGL